MKILQSGHLAHNDLHMFGEKARVGENYMSSLLKKYAESNK